VNSNDNNNLPHHNLNSNNQGNIINASSNHDNYGLPIQNQEKRKSVATHGHSVAATDNTLTLIFDSDEEQQLGQDFDGIPKI